MGHFSIKAMDRCGTSTCSKHDRRVAGVGAAGDSSNDYWAVAQSILLPTELEGDRSAMVFRCHLETLKSLLRRSELNGKIK